MIVGGPFDLIGLPLSSSSVPSALTPPSATSTPGVASTLSSVDAGIVGGAPKSALTGWAASTETSTPFWTRSNRLLNDSLMVSVNTSVPTTKATPMTTAKPVSTERSLRVSSPRSASLYTYATAFIRSSTPAASLPAPSCTTLPSSSTTSRLATAAATGSWVTTITVWPNSSTARRSRPSTSSEEGESRLPVGSSANSTAGRCTSARATATRCC